MLSARILVLREAGGRSLTLEAGESRAADCAVSASLNGAAQMAVVYLRMMA
jgi:hypothetical protein